MVCFLLVFLVKALERQIVQEKGIILGMTRLVYLSIQLVYEVCFVRKTWRICASIGGKKIYEGKTLSYQMDYLHILWPG